ncbi:MAG: penicillin-insensitive murein endopeptidase [Myxococcales bacterium]|nr:penicillin-insensitive murein endopeptidase [Myxococcales bacterium]
MRDEHAVEHNLRRRLARFGRLCSLLLLVLAPSLALSQPSSVGPRGTSLSRPSGRAAPAERLHPWVMPLAPRYHPQVASRARGSISVGTVTTGYLANAAELSLEGPHHRVLAKVAPRNTRFTTDELKELVTCAAARVFAAFPGHKLHLGNFSRRSGGDLPWSVSHNNGRDADLAFYARRPDGSIATPEHLYHFTRDLTARDSPEPMIFDVPANWVLVRALSECPSARPQRLFIARWLRKALLDFARASKEPKEVQARVARLLHQPRRALAHDDHLHIRIGCASDDLSEGCLAPGRAPHRAIGQSKSVRRRLGRLRRALRSSNAVKRAGAAYLLGLYEDQRSARRLGTLLDDPAADVRIRAAEALRWVSPTTLPQLLDQALLDEDSPAVVSHWLDTLEQLGATEQLARRLLDPRTLRGPSGTRLVVRRRAAELLATSGSLMAAQLLLPLVADDDPGVRMAARTSLERITNRSHSDLILEHSQNVVNLTPSPTEEIVMWQYFLAHLPQPFSRDDVVLAGFRRRGLPVEGIGRSDLTSFAIALGWPAPYRDNAADFIARVLRYRPEVGRGSYARPAQFWRPWLMRRRLVQRARLRGVIDMQRTEQMAVATPGDRDSQPLHH